MDFALLFFSDDPFCDAYVNKTARGPLGVDAILGCNLHVFRIEVISRFHFAGRSIHMYGYLAALAWRRVSSKAQLRHRKIRKNKNLRTHTEAYDYFGFGRTPLLLHHIIVPYYISLSPPKTTLQKYNRTHAIQQHLVFPLYIILFFFFFPSFF